MNLNLNEREKVRFSRVFLAISEAANSTANSIRNGNDDEIMKNFLMLQINFMQVKEFGEIAIEAVSKSKPSDSEFPDEIFPKG